MERSVRTFLKTTFILLALGISVQVRAQPSFVTEVPVNSTGFVTIGDLVYFRSGDELWRTDGTEAGTIFLESGFDVPSFFLEFNGAAYFTNANNSELWKSDGTPDGTVRLHASGNNELSLLGISDGSLFFQAYDAATGLELYRTDGTAAGTIMLKDINPGAASSIRRRPSGVILGNQLIFSADNGTNGSELWRSDGTSAGTVMIKDINPGPEHSIYLDGSYLVYNDLFYFIGITDEQGADPWVSDGTSEGTHLLKDINPGAASTPNVNFAIGNNGYLYFLILEDFGSGPAALWKTAGTETSTSFIKSIGDGATYNPIYSFRVYHDKVYFWNQLDYSTDILFVTDGTSDGTEAIFTVDTYDGSLDGSIYYFDVVNDYLLFTGTAQGYPTPFYRSDGTKAGTEEFALFTAESHPDGIANRIDLTTAGDFAFYADHDGPADIGGNPQDPADYYHLFQADGFTTKSMRTMFGVSTVGTNNITDFNGKVIFTTYDDRVSGGSKRLWMYDPHNPPTNVPTFTLVNADTDEDIKTLVDGDVITKSETENINIRFNPAQPPGSVRFTLNGSNVRTENAAPYSLAGDASGNYNPWTGASPGSYTLTATPYSASGAGGSAGTPVTIHFTIEADTGGEECMASGTILREYWDNVSGNRVSDIPIGSPPTTTSQLGIFEEPTTSDTNYGARIRGYICPPTTGDYTFWIASNDHSELWLSTDDGPFDKIRIAYITGATNSRQWDKFPTQKSQTIPLVAGQKYYIEALHKQGVGTGHVAVGWQLPGGSMERPIPGSRLSPADPSMNAHPVVTMTDPKKAQIFFAPADVPIAVDASDPDGIITNVEFFGGSSKIGEDAEAPYSFVWPDLEPGTYTVAAKATDNTGATTTSSVSFTVVSRECLATGTITREYWSSIQGSRVSDIPVDSEPTGTHEIEGLDISDRGTNYGARIRGYLCPPLTGDYAFYISSNDHSELWLSTDNDPSKKLKRAYVFGAADPYEWDKYPSQQSALIHLLAGEQYYIEVLHKQGIGTDHLSVAWKRPDGIWEGPILADYLSPFDSNAGSAASEETLLTRLEQISVYPNPAESGDEQLSISGYEGLEQAVETQIEILNLTGEVVYAEKISCGGDCGSYLMNMNKQLVPGVYLVNMKTEGLKVSKRLLVK